MNPGLIDEILERSAATTMPDDAIAWTSPAETTNALAAFVSDARKQRIEDVLYGRTLSIIPVIEGIANRGNMSAVVRTAEALGFATLHAIERPETQLKQSKRTSQGAQKWIELVRWPSVAESFSWFRLHGYRILTMVPATGAVPIDDINFATPTALVFGNEVNGVSADAIELCDAACTIPMSGFTDSFNISVAAALALQAIHRDRSRRLGRNGDLTEAEIATLRAVYYKRSVRRAGDILTRSE